MSQNCCGFKDAGEIKEKERNRVSFLSFLFILFLIRRTRLILFLLEELHGPLFVRSPHPEAGVVGHLFEAHVEFQFEQIRTCPAIAKFSTFENMGPRGKHLNIQRTEVVGKPFVLLLILFDFYDQTESLVDHLLFHASIFYARQETSAGDYERDQNQ